MSQFHTRRYIYSIQPGQKNTLISICKPIPALLNKRDKQKKKTDVIHSNAGAVTGRKKPAISIRKHIPALLDKRDKKKQVIKY